MIKIWANTIIKLDIKALEYGLSEKVLKNNLNNRVLEIYDSLRKSNPNMKVLALTQSFIVNSDPMQKILSVDMFESNRFIVKDGVIVGYGINIKDGEDKKRIAEKVIKKIGAKNIGVFADDYDDALLLKLKNLRFMLYKKKLERFIGAKDIIKLSFR